jgi:hypothetical protein
MALAQDEITRLGNVVLGKLMTLPIGAKIVLAAQAGIDVSRVPSVQKNAVVNPAIASAFGELDLEGKRRALPILAEGITSERPEEGRALTKLLQRHGYQYLDGEFVPVGLLDEREARYLPATATSELTKAITRLTANDESGAITAACGAVDATTTALYEKHALGESSASFQAKVNTALNRLGIFEKLESQLKEISIKQNDAKKIREEIHQAAKHATEALQVIRRTLGDVHGSKPAYKKIAYDTIKWASAICGLFEGE